VRQHPPLQIRMPLSEALKASYVSCIGFDKHRERYRLWQASGGVKGRLCQ